MTVQAILKTNHGIHFYAGLSSDAKPTVTTVPPGSKFWESDTDELYISSAAGWVKSQVALKRLAGERQEDSTTGVDHVTVSGEWATKAMAYNGALADRTVYDGPCLVRGIEVTTAMSAHASQFEDNANVSLRFPPSNP